MGLFTSVVLLTLARPTMVASMPETVPVNVGEAMGAFKFKSVIAAFNARSVEFAFKSKAVLDAFKSSAVCVAVLTGLERSEVLSTLARPTLDALIPAATLAFVITPIAISGLAADPDKSPANLILPLTSVVASTVLEAST